MATNNAINQYGILPSFIVTNTGDQLNVTGDASQYKCVFDTKLLDPTSGFDIPSSHFIAPYSGYYYLFYQIYLDGLSVAMTRCAVDFKQTVNTYTSRLFNSISNNMVGGTILCLSGFMVCRLNIGVHTWFVIEISNGAKTVDVIGSTTAGYRTPVFGGYMISGV